MKGRVDKAKKDINTISEKNSTDQVVSRVLTTLNFPPLPFTSLPSSIIITRVVHFCCSGVLAATHRGEGPVHGLHFSPNITLIRIIQISFILDFFLVLCVILFQAADDHSR